MVCKLVFQNGAGKLGQIAIKKFGKVIPTANTFPCDRVETISCSGDMRNKNATQLARFSTNRMNPFY